MYQGLAIAGLLSREVFRRFQASNSGDGPDVEPGMNWVQLSRQQKIMGVVRALAANPASVIRAVPGELQQYRRRAEAVQMVDPDVAYEVDEAWDEHLHSLLGAPWPCPQAQQLDQIMADIDALLAARGLGSGRLTYGWYSDAESSLCRAAWCVARHTRPEVVIETGVAHGVTSRVLLEALRQNNFGHLWSIDLPFPFDRRVHAETGAVITDACRSRWSYLEGSSSQRLPPLVEEVRHVEMFVHDSLHTADNTLFEMEQAASVMSPGGAMLVDDIGESRDAFTTFTQRNPDYKAIICPASDRDGIWGIFGIAIKAAAAA
jgi:Methyltransferase domain